MNEKMIITMTDAYITSYMRAMEKTRNPNIATQAAMGVCMVIGNQMSQQQKEQNPLGMILAAALSAAQKGGDGEDGEDGEPDPGPQEKP